jgi:hypothetical protein
MATLTLDQILAARELPREVVPVPEWGGDVVVQALSRERHLNIIEEATVTRNAGTQNPTREVDGATLDGLIFLSGVVEPQFSPEHLGELRKLASGPFSRIVQRVMAISGLTPEAPAAARKSAPGPNDQA